MSHCEVFAPPFDDAALQWFAVYTMPRHEKCVARAFEQSGIEHFLPLYEKLSVWRNRQRKQISLPLFPRYVFVRTARCERLPVLQTAGVVSIVGAGAVAVPDAEIEFLRGKVRNGQVEPYPELVAGRRVCVKSGPLAGLEGVLVRRCNRTRFVLTLQLIQQSASVEISAEDLELLSR
ncbi:MAG: UpxY family transcription antiterminator [Acidobacteriota bacterium]|nr:UpxY family transcription antiterminator [Acidobacteriota bacterium]